MFEGNVFGGLDGRLRNALSESGYLKPTPIQEKAIPHLLGGRDMIGIAQTGTGKTAAFMLPILQHLLAVRKPRRIGHPRALILSPTRELAVQTAENTRRYAAHANLPLACLIGGVSQYGQVKDVKKGAEIVIACPGRLIDLMTQGIIYLNQVECFVLDEADRMLDMGFLPDIKRIISKLPLVRQSMFFSATMSPEVSRLAGEMVKDPVKIEISPDTPAVEKINQSVMSVAKSSKDSLLIHLLNTHPEWSKVIVFAKMRHGADRVVRKLNRERISSAAIHSDKTQNQRTKALEGFKKGDVRVLVATDIASRGIDVKEVSCVVNLDLPLETESYVHRIGRTARAGESGVAVSFVAPEERGLLKAIERFIKKTIRFDNDHPFVPDNNSASRSDGLPQAPWNERGNNHGKKNRDGKKRRRKVNFAGRRQPDFRQKI